MAAVPVVVSWNLISKEVFTLYTWLERFQHNHVTYTHLEERQMLENLKRHIDEPVWRNDNLFYDRSVTANFLFLKTVTIHVIYEYLFNTETKGIYREYKMDEGAHRW
jgi:hypothetical protein